MLTGKKLILFGAGIIGRRAMDFFGAETVFCFTDNNKAGQTVWGKQVISFDALKSIKDYYDVVLTANSEATTFFASQCECYGIKYQIFGDLVHLDDLISNSEIQNFKDLHKGQRCFLVGNGPSLTAGDLTTISIHSEISFGCNAISEIFSQTMWRPNYFLAYDPSLFRYKVEMLKETEAEYKFFPTLNEAYVDDVQRTMKLLNCGKGRVVYTSVITSNQLHGLPDFSHDASKALYTNSTVMYVMIQLAIYMGFSKIYLVGVDGGTMHPKNLEAYLSEKQHFYSEDMEYLYQYNSFLAPQSTETIELRMENGYLRAEKYAREHNISILNATRGGKLEMFERVDFDTLFSNTRL